MAEKETYNSHLFTMEFNPSLTNGDKKTVTGQINLPKEESKKYSVILMLRGYVDQSTYKTGDGTRNAAAFFAQNGFITLAPDFLGYGLSSKETGNIFETRFQTYVTALVTLSSLVQIPTWDRQNVFIWAHSNGGQIALTTLAITKKGYPTVLWAPVTKSFPYSVLYYTDGSIDGGKFIRRELAKFENTNDSNLFSFTNYVDNIKAPILINQGTRDDAVPVEWSQEFFETLKSKDKDVVLKLRIGADHNMRPLWDVTIRDDLAFFKSHLKNDQVAN